MRVGLTAPMKYITGQRRRLTLAGWSVLGPSYVSENVVRWCSSFSVFFLYLFGALFGVRV